MAMNTELAALQHVLTDPAHGYFFDRWRAVRRLTRLARTSNGASPPLSEADARAVIDGLVAGLESVHWGVHRRCKRALETLQHQPLIDAVCNIIIERGLLQLRDIAVSARYEPKDPLRKAAYLFVLGRQQFYEAHDPTGALLVQFYEKAEPVLRDRLLELAHTRSDQRLALLTVQILKRAWQATTSTAEIEVVVVALKEPGFCLTHDANGARLVQFYQGSPQILRERLLKLPHEWSDQRWAQLILRLLDNPSQETMSITEEEAIVDALGQPQFYEVYDSEGEVLAGYYTRANQPERDRLLQAIRSWERRRGKPFFLGLLQGKGWAGLSDSELAVGVEVLSAAQQWDTVWELVRNGPLPHSWQAARKLLEGHWQPREARAAACWADLMAAVAGGADPLTVERTCWSPRAVLRGHTNIVRSVAFSPDGSTLTTGSEDRTIRLWDVAQGQERAVLSGHTAPVHSVAFSPDGATLASGSQDHTVRLWDVARGQERAVLRGHTNMVHSVAFSPDGATLASGSQDHTVRLWDVAQGQRRAVRRGHTDEVGSVAFSPDGTTLASGSADHTIRLRGVARGQARVVLQGHTHWVESVAFSPDGSTLASGSTDHTIRLWDVASGQQRVVLRGHTDRVWPVAFSPNGTTLASGGGDRTVRLWDVASGQQRAVLRDHTNEVNSVAFSPDGITLASGSDDRTVRLWEMLDLRRWTSVPLAQLTGEDAALAQRVLAAPSASAEQQAVARYVAAILRYRLGKRATKRRRDGERERQGD
ncbi:MAG: WD40 repeat domain-containing protein [Deltaproteobacteria bacterium]|nr:WD40 repeat domain-containing protein [Deltaproteobacteria bacterium]